MKIAIMGAGAIGSLFAGLLAEAGFNVIMIGREPHVKAVVKNGLQVSGVSGERVIEGLRAYASVNEVRESVDLLILTVKAYDTEQAALQASRLLSPNALFVCLQNGLGVESEAAKVLSGVPLLRGITNQGALLVKPGVVVHTGLGETVVGAYSKGLSDKVEDVVKVFNKARIPARASFDIRSAVWLKTLINAGINPLGALTGLRNGELLEVEGLPELMVEVVREGEAVARKAAVKLEEDPVEAMMKVVKATAQNKNSMLQDVEKGRRTEIDYINGAICRIGADLGVKTPLNALLHRLIKGLELKAMRGFLPYERR